MRVGSSSLMIPGVVCLNHEIPRLTRVLHVGGLLFREAETRVKENRKQGSKTNGNKYGKQVSLIVR